MKNRFKHNDDGTTHIFVESKSKYFPGKHTIIIDTEDWDKVKEHRWRLSCSRLSTYPYISADVLHPDGGWHYRKDGRGRHRRRTTLYLHHLICGKPLRGRITDHLNHNGLDNRKENLREATKAQNMHNSRGKNSTSQYKGVRLTKGKRWYARIKHNYKEIHIGSFGCEHEAALAYNEKALELWGEYAYLNEISSEGNKEKERKRV